MKVKQLIEELLRQNPDAEVYNYVQEVEEFGKTSSVYSAGYDDLPYSKGDKPNIDEEVVVVSGWVA